MADFQYVSDIINDALFRAGEPTNGTSRYLAQSINYLNNLYLQICRGGSELVPSIKEDWVWLRKSTPGILILQPPIITLTADVTLGSSSVTLSAAPENYAGDEFSVVSWFLKVQDNVDIYRVTAHTSGATSLTLDSVYTGSTATGADCKLFLTDYDLASDCMRLVAPMRGYANSGLRGRGDFKVEGSDLDTMEEDYPMAFIETGIPDRYAPIAEVTPDVKRVRFNACGGPDRPYRLEYEYLYRPTPLSLPGTSQEPALPRQFRSLLSDFLLAYLHGAKNDDRAGSAAQAAQAGLVGMASENRYQATTTTRNSFRIPYRSHSSRVKGPLRTESGSIIG